MYFDHGCERKVIVVGGNGKSTYLAFCKVVITGYQHTAVMFCSSNQWDLGIIRTKLLNEVLLGIFFIWEDANQHGPLNIKTFQKQVSQDVCTYEKSLWCD